jgi:hypothetical protein
MKEKVLGFIFVVLALGLGWFAMNLPDEKVVKPSRGLTFSEFVSEDLELLRKVDEKRKEKIIPEAWNSIQSVSYNFHNDFQKKLMNDQKLKIPESLSGTHKLEIEFIDVPDDESPSIILQMSMVEIASNNKVWELGRTYNLNAFLKEEDSTKKSEPKEKSEPANDDNAETPPTPSGEKSKE